jgi:hypothetical protein
MDEIQRAARREPKDCPDDTRLPVPVQLDPRPPVKCDPPEPEVPDIFLPPAAIPVQVFPPPYVVPILLVGNVAKMAACPPFPGPSYGDGTEVLVNAIQKEVILSDLPGLSETQGRFLSEFLSPDEQGYLLIPAAGEDRETLITSLRLQPSQLLALRDLIDAQQGQADDEAQALAESLLNCVWKNTCQEAFCEAGALADGTDCAGDSYTSPSIPGVDLPPVVNPARVVAGVFSSSTSQADADAQALIAAQQALVCLWPNEEVERDCTDEDLGFLTIVPGTLTADADSVPPPAGDQRGHVTVPAGIFFAASQDAANTLAFDFATSLLSCFYYNEEQVATCDPDADEVPAVVLAGHNPITVLADTVPSLESVDDANVQALALAMSQLDCYWENERQYGECQDRGLDANGTEVFKTGEPPAWPPGTIVYPPAAFPLSPVFSVEILAGMIVSKTSQADANAQALDLVNAQLSCRYCNKGLEPRCADPVWDPEEDPAPVGVITLAEIAAWIAANGAVLSRDITLGVAPGLYCAESPGPAQEIADSLADIPVRNRAGAECTWGNNRIRGQCVEKMEGSELIVGRWGEGERADLDQLSEDSRPDPTKPDQYIYVAENTIILTESAITAGLAAMVPPAGFSPAAAQDYVDGQAQIMARSFLNCFWKNQEITAHCRATLPADDREAQVYGLVDGTEGLPKGNYMPDLHSVPDASSNHTVVVPEKLYTSYTGQEDADSVALGIAISQLNCWVQNARITAFCKSSLNHANYTAPEAFPGPYAALGNDISIPGVVLWQMPDNLSLAAAASRGSETNPVIVASRQLTSYIGYLDANTQALAIAISQLDCWVKNKAVTAKCTSTLADATMDGNSAGTDLLEDGYTHANPASQGSDANPVVVGAGMFISYIGYLEANTLALAVAISQVNCWANCNCIVTAYLNFDNLILPNTCEGKNWMLAQAAATTVHVKGIYTRATASNTFAYGCGHCIFTGHKAQVIIQCDKTGYTAQLTPATNWAEVEKATATPEQIEAAKIDPALNVRVSCPPIGHATKEALPCPGDGSETTFTILKDGKRVIDPFVVTTTHNKWYVVVNGALRMSFNADSPPYDPTASTTPSC